MADYEAAQAKRNMVEGVINRVGSSIIDTMRQNIVKSGLAGIATAKEIPEILG